MTYNEKEKVTLEFDTFMMFDYAHMHYAKDIVRVLVLRMRKDQKLRISGRGVNNE